LYYVIGSYDFTNHVLAVQTGTAVPHISAKQILEFSFPLPPLNEQRAIAQILGSLDDKIEANRRMNETLEAAARAIFKSWFVDFDPVHEKSRGEQPFGMDAATVDLFPDSFEDSALGLIPAGWEVLPFEDVIDYREGPGIRNWQYTNSDEGIRFLNIRCIQNGDLKLDTANRVTEEEALGKYAHFLLEEDDLVVSTSGTLGRIAIVREQHLPLMLNTSIIRMRPIIPRLTKEFLWGYIASPIFQYELETKASGSVQKNFGPMHLQMITLLTPPESILTAYSEVTGAIYEKIKQCRIETDALAETRDALLPKLVSGEVRVGEIDL
jgi:type I restriction enzyme S subunit